MPQVVGPGYFMGRDALAVMGMQMSEQGGVHPSPALAKLLAHNPLLCSPLPLPPKKAHLRAA